MKKLFIVFMVIASVQQTYAQKKINLQEADENIRRILFLNNNPNFRLPDSVNLYSFYIKVTPKKNGSNQLHVNDSLAIKVFGNLDSLFRRIDFNVFLDGTKQEHVIIPIGILVIIHNKMTKKSELDFSKLAKGIPQIMAIDDPDRYKSVFLTPYFVITDIKSYY